ncbi:hypothetical protein BDP81DRAFT_118728 [Colletotrichum phormii]|uniref:Uncharacterized protein n=1 Tax=Colletotrichum phormii TaxID=359342 RepID=A0AAJ0EBA9_9PEZI|nr:uncharacterized protein BDP81DRAFT_118728 [Colletotrichum phormii]KAK1623523.1 hypothetical protein BDP81DRAFT_118728 [Colletotrichum phormii]
MRPATQIKVYPCPSQALPFPLREERKSSEVCKSTAHIAAPDTCSSQLSHHVEMVCQKRLVRLAKSPDGTYKANSWSILSNHAAYYSAFSNSSTAHTRANMLPPIPPFASIGIPSKLPLPVVFFVHCPVLPIVNPRPRTHLDDARCQSTFISWRRRQ